MGESCREAGVVCYEAKHTLTKELQKLKKDLEGIGIVVGPDAAQPNKVKQQVSAMCLC